MVGAGPQPPHIRIPLRSQGFFITLLIFPMEKPGDLSGQVVDVDRLLDVPSRPAASVRSRSPRMMLAVMAMTGMWPG